MEEKKKFLTYKDVSSLFGVSTVTIWQWAKNGILPCHKFGRKVYFIYDEIEEALKKSEGINEN